MHGLEFVSPYVRHVRRIRLSSDDKEHWSSTEMENLLIYVVSGSFEHIVGGQTHILSEGMLEIIPPYTRQYVGKVYSDSVELRCIHFDLFDCEESRRITEDNGNDRHLPHREMFYADHHTLGLIRTERRAKASEYMDLIENNYQAHDMYATMLTKQTMLGLLVIFCCAPPMNKRSPQNRSSYYVAEAIRYIHKNFSDTNLSVAAVAAHVGITPAHLSRVMRREREQTPSDCITGVRIAHAKSCFSLGKSITETSSLCGFLSLQSFSRTFRSVVGMAPREYVASLNNRKL
ncbi:MAG: helix-turn-helix transcriptional regulator [Clostridia bacterium]|nr:helix-turn-helix transcriptional regulator [Clostridia bacterium]